MLVTMYKIGEVHFRLLGTNDFHVKARNERFTAAYSHGFMQSVQNYCFSLSNIQICDVRFVVVP